MRELKKRVEHMKKEEPQNIERCEKSKVANLACEPSQQSKEASVPRVLSARSMRAPVAVFAETS